MNGKKVLNTAMPVVKNIVENLGYELVDLEYKKEHSGMVLEAIIYKNGGINLTDCETVSRALDGPLDELDPTDGLSYTLNVSSPGLDRPLKKISDFERNLGNEIAVKFFAPINGKKELTGILKSYDKEFFEIYSNGELIKVEIKKTAHIVPVINF